MINALTYVLALIFNTPLFYLICFFGVVGYIYAATQRHMRQMQWTAHYGRPQRGNGFTHVRMAQRHSEAVLCDECGRNIDHIAVRHTEDGGRLLLCHSCSKAYGKAQRAIGY